MSETGSVEEKHDQEEETSGFETAKYFVFDFLKVFLIAVAIIIPIRWFLFQPFVVTGDSMLPTFQDGNYLIVDEFSYHLRDPGRGEVVVLRFPRDPSQFFIKRIVGLPGERIVIENTAIIIYNTEHPDGMVLQESYLPKEAVTYGNVNKVLASDEFFVLGDNRLSSSDSRLWGALPRKNVVGRVYLRLLPIEELKLFSATFFAPLLH